MLSLYILWGVCYELMHVQRSGLVELAPMKIVGCSNMPFVNDAFSTLGTLLLKDGRAIGSEDVRDADLLAIRSTTQVNRELLEGSRVRFVGTATIGMDHMDTGWMDAAGIRWCSAAGCNANSVSEYFVAAMLWLAARHGIRLEGLTVGVVGVGNVGSLVIEKALALGLKVLANDPPRQEAEQRGPEGLMNAPSRAWSCPLPPGLAWTSLDDLLAQSDIVTLHVPLTRDGRHATWQMADRQFFNKLKPGAIFMNAARGPLVVTDDLLKAMDDRIVRYAVVDTWEGEPACRQDLMARVDLGTPHIAGYSFEGKVMGTVMVYEEACRFLNVKPAWSVERRWPPALVPAVTLKAAGRPDEEVLWDLVRRLYDIGADDARFRIPAADPSAHFDRLRKDYPVRREFRFTKVRLTAASARLTEKVKRLGFAME